MKIVALKHCTSSGIDKQKVSRPLHTSSHEIQHDEHNNAHHYFTLLPYDVSVIPMVRRFAVLRWYLSIHLGWITGQ